MHDGKSGHGRGTGSSDPVRRCISAPTASAYARCIAVDGAVLAILGPFALYSSNPYFSYLLLFQFVGGTLINLSGHLYASTYAFVSA
jgi:hypothetical protein